MSGTCNVLLHTGAAVRGAHGGRRLGLGVPGERVGRALHLRPRLRRIPALVDAELPRAAE